MLCCDILKWLNWSIFIIFCSSYLHGLNGHKMKHIGDRIMVIVTYDIVPRWVSERTNEQNVNTAFYYCCWWLVFKMFFILYMLRVELWKMMRMMWELCICQLVTVNNFPPLPACCPIKPCFYQDFVLDIPAEFQRIVKTVYYTWIGMMCDIFDPYHNSEAVGRFGPNIQILVDFRPVWNRLHFEQLPCRGQILSLCILVLCYL